MSCALRHRQEAFYGGRVLPAISFCCQWRCALRFNTRNDRLSAGRVAGEDYISVVCKFSLPGGWAFECPWVILTW